MTQPLPQTVIELLEEFHKTLLKQEGESNYKPLLVTRLEDILAQDRHAKRGERALSLVREVIYNFPQHATNEEINGADAVEWLMDWITRAIKDLA
jgi:hypothetical protein